MEKPAVAVDTRNLVKVYKGETRALDGIDLTVEAGIAFALLGPNGAGKTTLIRTLTTQLKPTSGEAYVFGLNVTREGSKIRRLISYVPQEVSVWTDISGYENLLVYAKIFGIPSQEREDIIHEALENMGLDEVSDNLVSTYSGGMVRRLEIASAMLIKPKIMFLDEPTIGLDPSAKKVVWERLTGFKKQHGVTVFFNTHYMDEADLYSDRIAIINRGKIVKQGTAEELKRSLGGEVILFNLQNTDVAEETLRKLRSAETVKDVILTNSELSILVEDAETSLPRIMDLLRNEGVKTSRISITKPTLDDVFLKYAGTRLETSGRISEVTSIRRMIRKG
jgi:ABC-2 type transport system ATP-binding protein